MTLGHLTKPENLFLDLYNCINVIVPTGGVLVRRTKPDYIHKGVHHLDGVGNDRNRGI